MTRHRLVSECDENSDSYMEAVDSLEVWEPSSSTVLYGDIGGIKPCMPADEITAI